MKVNGPGKRKLGQGRNYDYSALLRENILQLWVFNRGDLNISASTVPNNKDTFKTKRNGKQQHIKLFKQ